MGTQLSSMLLGLVDTLMVARVSVDALGALSLANVWIYGTMMFAQGILMGIDPIVSQAHGAGDGRRAGLALQRGIVLAAVLSVPVGVLFWWTDAVLIALGQQPELAQDAAAYARVQIVGIPCFLIFATLRHYLQSREIVRPALWVILAANLLNAGLNWLLIYGNWGAPALGLVGAGIATAVMRVAVVFGLVGLMLQFRLHADAWLPWSRAAYSREGLFEVLRYGLPIALQISSEIWAFSGASLLVGWLGPVPLAAHAVALNLASLAFMAPLGVSIGAVTRVGNLLGAGNPHAAQRAAWVAMALGAGVMTISALGFVVLRDWLPTLYTADLAVGALCATILPIAAAFQIFDGIQVVACGVLRGMGRVRPAMVFNLISYWLLGLPIGAWLTFRMGWGVGGIWWGLCFGLGIVAALFLAWIFWRGPARMGSGPSVRPVAAR